MQYHCRDVVINTQQYSIYAHGGTQKQYPASATIGRFTAN